MLAFQYKVTDWGAELTGGQEDCEKFHVSITFVAKRNSHSKTEVFNELVCMQLGRLVGLPVPVGLIVQKGGEPFYCSGNIYGGGEFPPANLSKLAQNLPEMACGIAVFDAWVCNSDRHAGNIFYDRATGTVFLVDHGRAILAEDGCRHLRQEKNRLELREEFAKELCDFSTFWVWRDRILEIPEHAIRATLADAAKVGICEHEASAAGDLLLERRGELGALFEAHAGTLFPRMQQPLVPFNRKANDDPPEYQI